MFSLQFREDSHAVSRTFGLPMHFGGMLTRFPGTSSGQRLPPSTHSTDCDHEVQDTSYSRCGCIVNRHVREDNQDAVVGKLVGDSSRTFDIDKLLVDRHYLSRPWCGESPNYRSTCPRLVSAESIMWISTMRRSVPRAEHSGRRYCAAFFPPRTLLHSGQERRSPPPICSSMTE